ncbi:hypothetical protein [Rathayibacter tanaceti]|uniref:Uncharacterized protein n=1 Tax=Rathayibacter tanaceti TaxID=1671680 RepID=A0AAE6RIY1_9MICO|nr:hypothetical protein [Rathayibacter tanaceti]QHC54510.1 hypothetical protein GSU10_01770 [Rathayibacter tanaceti]
MNATATIFLTAVLVAGCSSQGDSTELNEEQGSDVPVASYGGTEQAWSDFRAKYPTVDRPVVEVVRKVSLDEWPASQAECMTDAGFPKEVDNGGIGGFVPEGQEEAHDLASYICSASYPLDDEFSAPLSRSRLTELYTYFTNELTHCLESNDLQLEAAPSLNRFLDTYYTPESWSPFNDVLANPESQDRYEELAESCPPMPLDFTSGKG